MSLNFDDFQKQVAPFIQAQQHYQNRERLVADSGEGMDAQPRAFHQIRPLARGCVDAAFNLSWWWLDSGGTKS